MQKSNPQMEKVRFWHNHGQVFALFDSHVANGDIRVLADNIPDGFKPMSEIVDGGRKATVGEYQNLLKAMESSGDFTVQVV